MFLTFLTSVMTHDLLQGCCQFEDAMALRMIVAWMALVAIVVFVALVVEIITTSHQVTVGDIVTDHPNCSQVHYRIFSFNETHLG